MNNKSVSTTDAARILGVSGATVRNWCRVGHLSPVSTRPLAFTPESVYRLKERIHNNRFSRLRKRANKTATDGQGAVGLPDPKMASELDYVSEYARSEFGEVGRAVFSAALYYLQDMDEAILRSGGRGIDFSGIKWRRETVGNIMRNWFLRHNGPIPHAAPDAVNTFLSWKRHDDSLGLLYQSLTPEGRKAFVGAYFTPGRLIDDCLTSLGDNPASFLDPCCGTGRYLIRAAERFRIDPLRLHGFDADPLAVDIARLNLLLRYRDVDHHLNIHCLDSLNDLANGREDCASNHLRESVDAIATNPPWGGCKNQKLYKNAAALIRTGESFSLFLAKSLDLLRPGGRLSFLLPEAILTIKAHADVRRLILEQSRIETISLLGKVFSGVFTPIVRITLVKEPPPDNWHVSVESGGRVHRAAQERFLSNPNHAFDVGVTPRDEAVLEKIHAIPHVTLRGAAEWALGIVTGDNGSYVLDEPLPGTEPILRGRDIFKYAPRPPRCHIRFCPEQFQQVAPERLYRAPEKLIYRFISDQLVFAYDNRGILTLNSANVLIPRIPELSIKSVLAFLNSRVFQYLFNKRFRTRKVLRGDLEMLPLPLLTSREGKQVDALVDRCMGGDYTPAEELNQLVYNIFRLDSSDIHCIDESLFREKGGIPR